MLNTIQTHKMLTPRDHILTAVSGGADSVALLFNLLTLQESFPISITVCHINHNLRGAESDADEAFVRELCEKHSLPFLCHSIEIKGGSLEEAARQARYDCLQKAAQHCGANKIALGHNLNDNAETLLLRLCRGTGLAGLGGIPPVRGNIIRPLIETERAEIEAYLNARGIPYRTDSTNADTAYTRNRIRHEIIPALQQINPQIVTALANSAALLRGDEELLSALCPEPELHIPTLQSQSPAMRRRVIRAALLRAAGLRDISAAHIAQIEALLTSESGKLTELPHGLRVRREYDRLLIYENSAQDSQAFCTVLPLDTPIFVPALGAFVHAKKLPRGKNPTITSEDVCTKYFNYDKINGTLQFRTRLPGDRIALEGVGTKKIKDFFSDRKIPRGERGGIPMLAAGSDILWVMDRTNADFSPEPGGSLIVVSIKKTQT